MQYNISVAQLSLNSLSIFNVEAKKKLAKLSDGKTATEKHLVKKYLQCTKQSQRHFRSICQLTN